MSFCSTKDGRGTAALRLGIAKPLLPATMLLTGYDLVVLPESLLSLSRRVLRCNTALQCDVSRNQAAGCLCHHLCVPGISNDRRRVADRRACSPPSVSLGYVTHICELHCVPECPLIGINRRWPHHPSMDYLSRPSWYRRSMDESYMVWLPHKRRPRSQP